MDSIIYVSPDNKFKVIDLNKEYGILTRVSER